MELRILKAAKNTFDGMKVLCLKERSFRQELVLSIIIIPLIFFLSVAAILKLLLILLLFLLLVIEIINSAIEATIDRISLEFHPQSKIAKDLGSAAVGMVIVMNLIAWVYVLFFV